MTETNLFPPIFNTLLSCLHTQQPVDKARLAELSVAEWESLVELAFEQNIAAILYHRLKTQNALQWVPSGQHQRLQAKVKQTTIRNLGHQAELKKLTNALNEADIPVLALKGIYLASIIYPQIGLRPMGDIDLLVPMAKAIAAAKIAHALGYALPRDFADMEHEFAVAHHLPVMFNPDGIQLEIHGNLVHPHETHAIDPAVWWQNAVEAEIAGTPVKVLSPVDLFLHLCLHISFQHEFKADLRHYYDLVMLTTFFGDSLDWVEVMHQTETRGWTKGVGLTLCVANWLFGLSLPPTVNSLVSQPDFEMMAQFAIAEMLQNSVFFSGKNFIPTSVAQFQYKKGVFNRISYILQRIFVPKTMMSKMYPVSATSPRIYLYYLVRLKDLFQRHTRTLWQMNQGEKTIVDSAARTYTLWEWLNES